MEYVLMVCSVLAKAPYKELDNVLTLVNTMRTDVSRGAMPMQRSCKDECAHDE
jgi:hypothetical protein